MLSFCLALLGVVFAQDCGPVAGNTGGGSSVGSSVLWVTVNGHYNNDGVNTRNTLKSIVEANAPGSTADYHLLSTSNPMYVSHGHATDNSKLTQFVCAIYVHTMFHFLQVMCTVYCMCPHT